MQKDVVAESAEILKLGLLFGEDIDATTDELPAVLSFQHKLIQEYLAAVYIAENTKQDSANTFLTEAFQTWDKIETHREVVQFACGISVETDATPIINHVAKVLVTHMRNELSDTNWPSLSIIRCCQKEVDALTINPYLSEYPACGHPLAEVLANTELAYISDIDEKDMLDLNPRSTDIIVELKMEGSISDTHLDVVSDSRANNSKYDRLWQAFHSIHANVIAIHLSNAVSANTYKLHHFPQLKCVQFHQCASNEAGMADLAESIDSWGPQPQLRFCWITIAPITEPVMTALSKCANLLALYLWECDLSDKLSTFMASPPRKLRELDFKQCCLHSADVDHITQAVREGRFSQLEELEIMYNPVGEAAVGSLLEAFLTIRPHTKLRLELNGTGVDEHGNLAVLSKDFVAEWKAKLTNTNIIVPHWS